MVCTCGHPIEDHDGPTGSCTIEECSCGGYEEEEEDYLPSDDAEPKSFD